MAINVTYTPQNATTTPPQVLAWFSDTSPDWQSPNFCNYYRVVTTPAPGYRPIIFNITRRYRRLDGTYDEETLSRTVSSGTVYPEGSPDDHTNADVLFADWELYDGSTPPVLVGKSTVIAVAVVFERTYVPTHLLVNSSTVLTPAKLVYDPTTNLLVADY